MKKLLTGFLALGSISSFAGQRVWVAPSVPEESFQSIYKPLLEKKGYQALRSSYYADFIEKGADKIEEGDVMLSPGYKMTKKNCNFFTRVIRFQNVSYQDMNGRLFLNWDDLVQSQIGVYEASNKIKLLKRTFVKPKFTYGRTKNGDIEVSSEASDIFNVNQRKCRKSISMVIKELDI